MNTLPLLSTVLSVFALYCLCHNKFTISVNLSGRSGMDDQGIHGKNLKISLLKCKMLLLIIKSNIDSWLARIYQVMDACRRLLSTREV